MAYESRFLCIIIGAHEQHGIDPGVWLYFGLQVYLLRCVTSPPPSGTRVQRSNEVFGLGFKGQIGGWNSLKVEWS